MMIEWGFEWNITDHQQGFIGDLIMIYAVYHMIQGHRKGG